jgi:ubiquinol-cytochrome c reductase iron-sulfur subunit
LKNPEFYSQLLDPLSKQTTQQPVYIKGDLRSIKEEVLVVIGICTHLGCVPDYKADGIYPKLPADRLEHYPGYFCPCHGSKYDMAGRVFKSVPAPLNLVIPPYEYLNEHKIKIGNSS